MQRNLASGFDDSFRRHLAVEQRRAVLDTIARELTADTTLGDIVDAAQDLGWGDSLGELRLADLAGALLGEAPAAPATAPADHDADADDDEQDAADADDEAEDTEEEEDDADDDADDDDAVAVAVAPPPRRGRKPAARPEPAAAPRKPSSLDRALDRIDKALAARGRKAKAEPRTAAKTKPAPTPPPPPAPTKAPAKKAAAPAPAPAPVAKKAAAKKTAAKKAAARLADDDTDAMSLDQAAKMLVPMVRKLREATMQDLEEQTGMGRRKLRFHIGQLVKHGRLKRHGMGRGTCYTVK